MVIGVVEGAVGEHGAGDAQEAVADAAEGAGMDVAAGAEVAVALAEEGVADEGDAGSMVEGEAQALVTGITHGDHALAAALFGYRGDAGQGAQGLIVSPLQKPVGFGEQDGEDGPADPGQGGEDCHVILLGRRSIAEGGEVALGLRELVVDQAQAGDEHCDHSAICKARGHAFGQVDAFGIITALARREKKFAAETQGHSGSWRMPEWGVDRQSSRL